MFNYSKTIQALAGAGLNSWADILPQQLENTFASKRWGDLPKWYEAVKSLPDIKPSSIDLNASIVRIGDSSDCNEDVRAELEKNLRTLHPWRKGPFNIFGINIDTEWRSDFKWDRLKDHIDSLQDRLVLDVGCGNGYFGWRMKGTGAKLVVGVDTTMLYPVQFQVVQKYMNDPSVTVLPLGIDDVPKNLGLFDTAFSMGLLYHRRSPLDHLLEMKSFLRDGGQLVLETLVIEGNDNEVLTPKDRYACMPNVWFIPSCKALEGWLSKVGFKDVKTVNVTPTALDEQRVTDWMGFQSLENFLDPADSTKTIEGYPAPVRAILTARK